MTFDQYQVKARIAPTLITVVLPALLFSFFFVNSELSLFIDSAMGVKVAAGVAMPTVMLFFSSEFCRSVGKFFESFYFKDERAMPTTTLLLYSDKTYTRQYKKRIRAKMKAEFSAVFPSEMKESQDEDSVRAKIVETMALVRKKLKGNMFLHQHNIEYGAMRNLIGGSVLGLLLSLWNLYFFTYQFPSELAIQIGKAMASFYLLVIVFSKPLLVMYGKAYAKLLFREFMG